MLKLNWVLTTLLIFSAHAYAADVGIVTSLTGSVQLKEGQQPAKDIKSFVKLRDSDKLLLKEGTRLQIVFFENGVQETWQGAGELQLGSTSSQLLKGQPSKEQKTLPTVLVKQLTKTPSPERGRAGMIRTRALASETDLASLEQAYASLRKDSAANDRSPDLYLLAGYFELREFAKIEQHLDKLRQQQPQDAELAGLKTLYTQAMADAKSGSSAAKTP